MTRKFNISVRFKSNSKIYMILKYRMVCILYMKTNEIKQLKIINYMIYKILLNALKYKQPLLSYSTWMNEYTKEIDKV